MTHHTTPLLALRKSRGITREALAHSAGLSLATVYRAEHGLHRPTDDTLSALAGALGVTVEVLQGTNPSANARGSGEPAAA